MAGPAPEQSQSFMLWLTLILGVIVQYWLIGDAVRALSEPIGNDPTNAAIKKSAVLVPLLWLASGPLLLFIKRGDVPSHDRWVRISYRFNWTYVCVLCQLHIAVAFHLGHAWSHENAWEHTRRAGGYGDGVYVNYAFALVWLIDALWLCVAYESYFARPRWLSWAIHLFLAFVVFNAAVVFAGIGSGARFIGCALLLVCITWFYQDQKGREPNGTPSDSPPPENPGSGNTTGID